ncbi:MAG: GGDEF domain-containing protein [Arcobacteraceae bacterium]
MKDKMINLIKLAIEDKNKFLKLENIYTLYDQLQYSENLNEMANSLVEWLHVKYAIVNVNFSLFDMENNKNTTVVKKGKDFYLDGHFSFYFIINTHTEINAVVSFAVEDKEQYTMINEDKNFIDAAFFQISPILQNGIIKKHHIESSSIDSVTNVHNRKYLIEHIHKIIALSNKKEENISFLMIGIDRFKAVIEEFDYDIGDKVLVELAKVIHKSIKNFDIVARLTGDEFLVALVNLKSNDEAQIIAQKLIEEFAKAEIVVDEDTNQVLKKTICIGISSFPQDSEDINQVLKNADNFLNEAKNKGRSQFAVYKKEEESTIDLF